MSERPGVPRLAASLVSISLPGRDRGTLLGDLEEQFLRRAGARGARVARRWYWGQALRLAMVLAPRRVLGAVLRVRAPGTVRMVLRSLVRSPGSSMASAVTLAVGMAIPVAMFALAGGVTRSLPGDPADRVARISLVDGAGRTAMGVPWPVVQAWRDHADESGQALDAMAAFRSDGPVAVGDGVRPAGRYWGVYATSGLFPLLGVSPILGRLYADEEDLGLPAVLIREDVWSERFDRDPEALGSVLRIDGIDHLVVGVLPRDFGFPVDHALWMQRSGDEDESWSVVGRLASGADPGIAREQLQTGHAGGSVLSLAPGGQGSPTVRVESYTRAHFTNDIGDELSRYVGWISLILLVLSALNVAALMIALGASRARETAIRRAMGASRWQVMAFTLTESLLLAVSGGLIGLVSGRAALEIMVRYLTSQATIIPYWIDFDLGRETMALVGLLVLLAVLVSGMLPALRASRTDLDHALRTRPHDPSGNAARAMTWLVGLEVTLSCFLLALAAVSVEEARRQLDTGAEFPTEGVLTGQVVLDARDYPDRAGRAAFFASVLHALQAHPSVGSAALTVALPGKDGAILPAGMAGQGKGSTVHSPAQVRSIDPRFLDLLQLPLLAGRRFADADDDSQEPVAIVNEAFARRHDLSGSAVGRTIEVERLIRGEPHTATIVGVVADRGVTPFSGGRPVPGVYLPFEQVPARAAYLLVQVRADASFPEIWHDVVGPLDPYLPLGQVLSLDETLRRGHAVPTLFGSVLLALGASTLLVALVGLYGVHAQSLARRVREIGLRRAMGGRETRIAWESVSRGLRPVWVGVPLGTIPGVLTARLVVPMEPDLLGILAGPILFLATSLIVLWRPTWTASRAHPMEALREG